MNDSLEYKSAHSSWSCGTYGAFGIKILVGATHLPDLFEDSIQDAVRQAAENIQSAVMEKAIAKLPEISEAAQRERSELLSAFPSHIYAEEIPNGYCSRWCCKHLPWFIVTTSVGRFKLGWRKRVIQIDWKDTRGTKTAEQLFAKENVTKGEKMIHAWSVQDAKRYMEAIIASATEAQP